MPKSIYALRKILNKKYAVLNFLSANKALIISFVMVILLGLITGIFVAVKSGITITNAANFDLCIIDCSGKLQFAGVWARLSSVLVNMLILLVASTSVFLLPLGFITLAYRAYLLGFNITLLVCLCGFGGAISAIIVIVPCQLVLLALEVLFCIIMVHNIDCKKKFGRACGVGVTKWIFLFLIALFVVCLLETMLLGIFSARTILVI